MKQIKHYTMMVVDYTLASLATVAFFICMTLVLIFTYSEGQ